MYLNVNIKFYEQAKNLISLYYIVYIYKVYSVCCVLRFMRGNNIRIAVTADIDPYDLVACEASKCLCVCMCVCALVVLCSDEAAETRREYARHEVVFGVARPYTARE